MSDIDKVGLLLLNEDHTKFLVTAKAPHDVTDLWIMPGGGRNQGHSDVECLAYQIDEELSCRLIASSLQFIGEYVDVAAGLVNRNVRIRLYQGTVEGTPVASAEIVKLGWIGKDDLDNDRLSPIIKNKILPDVIEKGILK